MRCADQVGRLLGDHHYRRGGVSRGDRWHDRGIDDAQPVETHPPGGAHPRETPTPTPKRLTSHVSENFGESGKSGPVSRVAGKFLGVVALAKKYDRKGKLKHAEEAT